MYSVTSALDWFLAVKRYFSTVDQLLSLSDRELKSLGMSRLDIHEVALDSFLKNIQQ